MKTMKFIATRTRFTCVSGILATALLTACSGFSPSIGVSFPLGGMGAVGVSVGTDGRIGGTVGVGVGGASVNVGTSGHLPGTAKSDTPGQKTETTTNKTEPATVKVDAPTAPASQ